MTAETRTDGEIKKDIVNHLFWDGCVDATSVKVEVYEGEVFLTGTVPDYTAYKSASDDAWSISGVTNVRNDLTIKFSSDVKAPSDVEIKTNIENILFWQSNIDSTDIDATVNNGWVIVQGSIDAYWKKVKAEELILGLSGVLGLTNELTIIPTERINDKTITVDIEAALERQFNIDQNLIDVKVENGQVKLAGSVGSLLAFRAAQRIAENTPGVLVVNNELAIR